ncbi:MAG: VOC family protein [Gammaproteobacteria bacterium]|nr:VOC family protein [Gammaproteobacteria bacterium]
MALLSSRFEESRRFYTELMGMDIEWEPDSDNVYLSSGNDNLAIHRRMSDESNLESRLDHIGFIVRHDSQVDAWFDYLKRNNVPIAATPKTHRDGSRSCYVLDPDETQVQIIHHPPIVQSLG